MAIFSKRDFQIRTFVVTQKKRASFTRLYNYYMYFYYFLEIVMEITSKY